MACIHPRTTHPLAPLRRWSPIGFTLIPLAALLAGACGDRFQPRDEPGGGGGAHSTGPSGGQGGMCGGRLTACGNACVDLQSSTAHCGRCDHACPSAGAPPVCSRGICQTPTCPADHADCDGDRKNGCEADLRTDPDNCGGCRQPCATRCEGGQCLAPLQIAAGARYACAVLSNGEVWCWGSNDWGNLGDGTTGEDRLFPTRTTGLPQPAKQIAAGTSAGRSHTCAVLKDGTVACWGSGNSGQLGNGAGLASPTPVLVKGLTSATQVTVGGAHTCAVNRAGELWCWGQGGSGQLGTGNTDDQLTPVKILDGVAEVAAGVNHTCARMLDQTVRCWGANTSGQLGIGVYQPASTPTTVMSLAGIATLAVGPYHACAAAAGGVWCWGEGADLRLGTGNTSDQPAPQQLSGIMNVKTLALGLKHSGAVLIDGSISMWGNNTQGQLGTGTTDPAYTPQPIGLAHVTSLSLGEDHTCALTDAGEALCWGANDNGQLGNGSTIARSMPGSVSWPVMP